MAFNLLNNLILAIFDIYVILFQSDLFDKYVKTIFYI